MKAFTKFAAITPAAAKLDVGFTVQAIYVGVTGNVIVHCNLQGALSSAITFIGVPAGTVLHINPVRVTSGTSLVAMGD